MATLQTIKPNDSVSQYRQLKRQIKQARLTGESEVAKMEKCAFIDIDFTKKCLSKESSAGLEHLLKSLQREEEENDELLLQLKLASNRLEEVEK